MVGPNPENFSHKLFTHLFAHGNQEVRLVEKDKVYNVYIARYNQSVNHLSHTLFHTAVSKLQSVLRMI